MASSPKDKVGYGRPPQETQFQPGHSGNPAGRRKGQKNLSTDLAEELGETIRIREGDREHSVSKQRAMIKALVAKALKGDPRAASLLFGLIATQVEAKAGLDPDTTISSTDQEIIADFLRRHADSAQLEGASDAE